MDRKQKANQIEKLLSKLLFDKRNIKIDVTPISEAQYKTAGYPSWRKYVVNVHVDPFKFNNVTDEYSEEYYDFMIEVEDIISDSVKYIGTDSYELLTTFVIDKQDDFIKMMEKIIYDKWDEVEMEYWIETETNLPELDEISIRPRGISYPEFTLYVGIRKQLYGDYHKAFWKALQEKLPITEMFVEIV
jgi:hypothetical protein